MRVPLSQMSRLAEQQIADLQARFVEQHTEVVTSVQEVLTDDAPKVTGEFQASITPYGAEGPQASSVPHAQNGKAVQGAAEVEQALAGWQPGMPSGHASADPAAVKLAFGSSRQAAFGWMVRSVLTGIAKASINSR